MGKECLLQLQNVTKRYGDKIALNNFSMDICPGEIVALIGENGAGKTTLLNIICGYIKPSAGQVQYKGENIIEKPLAIREFGILIEPQLLVCVGTYMILYIIMNLMSYMDGIKYLSPLHYIVAVSSNTLQFTFSTMIFSFILFVWEFYLPTLVFVGLKNGFIKTAPQHKGVRRRPSLSHTDKRKA